MRPVQGMAREERQAEEPAQPQPKPAADVMGRWWLEVSDADGEPFDVLTTPPTVQAEGHRLIEVVPADRLRGAVERIKGLRLAVNPKDPDEREAAYARGYLAAVSDALETIVGGQ
jgi:hypothetical protein